MFSLSLSLSTHLLPILYLSVHLSCCLSLSSWLSVSSSSCSCTGKHIKQYTILLSPSYLWSWILPRCFTALWCGYGTNRSLAHINCALVNSWCEHNRAAGETIAKPSIKLFNAFYSSHPVLASITWLRSMKWTWHEDKLTDCFTPAPAEQQWMTRVSCPAPKKQQQQTESFTTADAKRQQLSAQVESLSFVDPPALRSSTPHSISLKVMNIMNIIKMSEVALSAWSVKL